MATVKINKRKPATAKRVSSKDAEINSLKKKLHIADIAKKERESLILELQSNIKHIKDLKTFDGEFNSALDRKIAHDAIKEVREKGTTVLEDKDSTGQTTKNLLQSQATMLKVGDLVNKIDCTLAFIATGNEVDRKMPIVLAESKGTIFLSQEIANNLFVLEKELTELLERVTNAF